MGLLLSEPLWSKVNNCIPQLDQGVRVLYRACAEVQALPCPNCKSHRVLPKYRFPVDKISNLCGYWEWQRLREDRALKVHLVRVALK